MKYAFTSFSCPQLGLDEILALAARLGYDGVELTAGASARGEIRKQSERSGVTICCLGSPCKYSRREDAPAQVEETLRYIDLAADLGVPLVRVFGGRIPSDVSREDAADSIVASLRAVADHAARCGITIVQETHDDWCAPTILAELMRQVDHQAVGLLWDYMHTARHAGASIDAAFSALRPWIRHVHFHDSTLRRDRLEFRPMGAGALDTRRVVELLLVAGYEGYLSGEWLDWEPYDLHLPRELAAVKRYERELREPNDL
jgi:sugar phosphate isomerase/epimerase